MKKKYIFISIFLLSSIIVITIIFKTKPTTKNSVQSNVIESSKNKEEKCKKVDNKYNIILVTNNDNKVEKIETCTTCEDKELTNLTRDGFDFDGWYYDSDFKTKINSNKIKELIKKEKKDNNCLVGYEDITIYAKWNEKPKEEQPTSTPEIVENIQVEEQPASTSEVVENINFEEPTPIEEQSLPQEQTTEDTIPNTCDFKKPVEYGKFIDYGREARWYNSSRYNYMIVTNPQTPIYASTCGLVYYIKTYRSNFNYINNDTPALVSEIYTLSKLNGEYISIVYMEVTDVNVSLGQIIDSDTLLGKTAVLNKNVFIHRLPYMGIYIQKGKAEFYNNTVRNAINPQSLLQMPYNEFWNGR